MSQDPAQEAAHEDRIDQLIDLGWEPETRVRSHGLRAPYWHEEAFISLDEIGWMEPDEWQFFLKNA